MKDDLGDRMKMYEEAYTSEKLPYEFPIYARLDGRSFSKFTKNMHRPYDPDMADAMIQTTKDLVKATNAIVGYTQSDEISLAWDVYIPPSEFMFSGKIQKMVSTLAAQTTAFFIKNLAINTMYDSWDIVCAAPHFDCRILDLPSRTEVANMFLWRANDARKNAVSAAARMHFSHKELQGKSSTQMLEMMKTKCYFDNYPSHFRYGTFVQKRKVEKFSEQLDDVIERSAPVVIDSAADFINVSNREDFIFESIDPVRKNVILPS